LDAELRKTLSLSFKLSQLQRSVEKLAQGEKALVITRARSNLKSLIAMRGQEQGFIFTFRLGGALSISTIRAGLAWRANTL
jgi:hypothetical protein